ncbi:MAG: aldehyde ferredoxin oxidoreductase C-terminal domain-containing protein, partial [Candidatus Binatia bacterium]
VEGVGRVKGPEYETIGLMGSNLEIPDLKKVAEWSYLADDLGMDTISLGSVLAFTMELQERGMLYAGLHFGDAVGVSDMIKDIAHRRGLGSDLAEGVKRMSEKYGGQEFAIHVKGLELSAYDPRGSFAQGVEYATTNRGGCHIQGASMYLESTGPLTINPQNLKLKAELPIVQQNLACAINSMVLCMFTTYGIIPKAVHNLNPNSIVHRLLTTAFENSGPLFRTVMSIKGRPLLWFEKWLTYITGETFSSGHLQEIGARIFNLERMYNLREGFTGKDDTLPPRILHESTFKHMSSGHPLDQLLPRYYQKRGWAPTGCRRGARWSGCGSRSRAMSITVEVTYDMSKALGVRSFAVDGVRTVQDVVRMTRDRFGPERGDAFETLTRVAAVSVNGVLINHRDGLRTALADGDTVTFLKAAAGG